MAHVQDVGSWTVPREEERPLKELVKQLGNDASLLVKQEMELARREIDGKLSAAKKEAVALAVGGAVAYAGMLCLCAGIILVLANWMAAWLAALIVGALVTGGGAALIVIGKMGLQRLDPVPREAIRSVRTDFNALQHAAR